MGTIPFYEEAFEGGVKPILGTENLRRPRSARSGSRTTGEYAYHLILLAETTCSLLSFVKLPPRPTEKGFYYRPRHGAAAEHN